jgi:hypothetical protein
MTQPSTTSSLLSPRVLFITGTLGVLLALTLSPQTRALLGVFDHGRWFLDSHAVLYSSDVAQAGLAPGAARPYDPLLQVHHYSDWWFGLGALGLTREDNFLVGGTWVLLFLLAVFVTVRPQGQREAFWLVLLTGSPPVMLGLIRANSDLVIFATLALVVPALRKDSLPRLALGLAAIVLATGLKFYPVAAGFVFLLIPSPRRMLLVTVGAAVILGAVLGSVGAQLHRGLFKIEPEIYTMGGRIWFMDAGLAERPAIIAAVILFCAGAALVAQRGWTSGLARQDGEPGERVAMTMAAVLLVSCFLAVINFGYRWIFALWLAPWLWRQRPHSAAARIIVWLLPVALWHDAVLCLATNLWFPGLSAGQYDRILVAWRLVTEPLVWVVMILLGGWLLDLTLERWREVRRIFSPPRAG